MSRFTFGAELEIADFTRSKAEEAVKPWGVLDRNDCTVVNSDGTVGNPYEGDKGGEIVTKIAESPQILAEYCSNIVNVLDEANINHSCWLHIHVGVNRELSLIELKDIATSAYHWSLFIRDNSEINPPKILPNGEVHELRNKTRTSVMTEEEFKGCQSAETVEEFWSFFERKRHLINIRPLKTYGTIEYRFLPATLEYDDFLSAAKMVEEITTAIIDGKDVYELNNKFTKSHTIIDIDLESKFRAQKVEYRDKVDNFTGEKWNG